MFRTLSRILRNNHIIRICAICSLVIILSFSSVFAHPTFTDVSGMNQIVYNFTLWSDYSTTVNANYGTQTPTLTDLNLASLNLWLQKMEYYIAEQTQNMHVYVPSTKSVQTLGNKHIPEMLSYLTYNTAYIAQNTGSLDSDLISIDNSISYLNGQMNNALYDYQHIGQSSWSVGSTSRNTAVNTYNLNHIDWTTGNTLVSITDPNGNVISQGSSIAPPYCDFHFGAFNTSNDSIYKFSLAIAAYSYRTINTFIDHVEIINGTADFEPIIVNHYYTGQNAIVNVLFSNINTNTRDLILRVYLNDYGYASRTDSTMYYINSDNIDYYTASNNSILRALLEKDFTASISGDVQIDTTDLENKINDVISAIDDVSLVDNDVKLNLTINNNTGSNGTNIINRLQNFFDSGTSISDFFDNVDDAESGWFTQTNSDLINTLSGGYVNLYE